MATVRGCSTARLCVDPAADPFALRHTQQLASAHEQIRQPRGDLQSVQVLGKFTVSDLLNLNTRWIKLIECSTLERSSTKIRRSQSSPKSYR